MSLTKLFPIVVLAAASIVCGGTYNTIELRNDSAGSEYFTALTTPLPVVPHVNYYLSSKNPDVWTSTTTTCHNSTVGEGVLWGISVTYKSSDGVTPQTTNPILNNIDLPTGYTMDPVIYTAFTRAGTGGMTSKTLGDHQKDWDNIVSKKNQILAAAGLTDDSPAWDKAFACAKWICDHFADDDGHNWGFPVDALIHGGACASRANTMVAFCTVMGIPSRIISWWDHTVAEVYINGHWHFVNNFNAVNGLSVKPGFEFGPLMTYSYIDLLLDPAGHGLPRKYLYFWDVSFYYDGGSTKFTPPDASPPTYLLEAYNNWIFAVDQKVYRQAYNQVAYLEICMSPRSLFELSVLYPERSTVTYKCMDSPIVWLTPSHYHWPTTDQTTGKQIAQDNGIRQQFYLPSRQGIASVKSDLLFLGKATHNMPADGGSWYYLVNGQHKYYLKDNGGWSLKNNYEGSTKKYIEFNIPLSALDTSGNPPSPRPTTLPHP